MIDSEKQLYIRETEEKPNYLAVIVMAISLGIVFLCWIANEIGFFRLDRWTMRIGMFISVVVTAIPLIILALDRKQYSNPKIKYLILLACFGYTMTITTMLTFHSEILLILPMFLAMLYRSKKLGAIAVAVTIVCTVCSPVLGCFLGTWDVPLFEGLIRIATGGTVKTVDPTYIISMAGVGEILAYIVLPRLLLITPCTVLMFHVISIGTDHVRSEILLNRINNRDMLTGLYNQNYFKQMVEHSPLKGNVGVLFFDVNGLKAANDKYGHEYGDMMIKKCAKSVNAICADGSGIAFRLGGDEFLSVFVGADEDMVQRKITEWQVALDAVNRENIEERNGLECSMAVGYSIGDFAEINSLTRFADANMYKNKMASRQGAQGA